MGKHEETMEAKLTTTVKKCCQSQFDSCKKPLKGITESILKIAKLRNVNLDDSDEDKAEDEG